MRKGFTLIELLVVIAIIAILAIVVVLTLNPAQLLAQGRDSNRVSDMSTLNSAISLYNTDQGGNTGYSVGSVNTVYVSLPDPNATTTAGSNCSSLGLPTLPSTYTYHCAASSTYRNINGLGWMPINFASTTTGTPLGSLPIDPTNNSSSRLYYTYVTNVIQFETTAQMESQKYQAGGSSDQISGDGGPLATVYEKGSQLGLEPLDYGDNTLVGWWPLTEGTGTVAYDESGNNATGSWSGTQAGTNGYYSPGKVGAWAGTFDGTSTYISISDWKMNYVTLSAWIKTTTSLCSNVPVMLGRDSIGGGPRLWQFRISSTCKFEFIPFNSGGTYVDIVGNTTINDGNWHYLVGRWDGVNANIYVDGKSDAAAKSLVGTLSQSASPMNIGRYTTVNYFPGLIDDVRIYNRALSAAQIAAMYAGGK